MVANDLNPKQQAFAEEYVVDMNATQAAIRAGYKPSGAPKVGPRMVADSRIFAEIQRLRKERSKRLEVDQDYVIRNLVEITERCMQHEPVLDQKGKPTGEYAFREQGAIRALELLGKHMAMFTDKTDVSITGTPKIKVTLKDMVDDE